MMYEKCFAGLAVLAIIGISGATYAFANRTYHFYEQGGLSHWLET